MSTRMKSVQIKVKPVAFSQFDGSAFERLAFAYLIRSIPDHQRIDWYGQLGGDRGRDIWVVTKSGEDLIATGDIRLCGCGQKDCAVHMIKDRAAEMMDRLRTDILVAFKNICPGFAVPTPVLM